MTLRGKAINILFLTALILWFVSGCSNNHADEAKTAAAKQANDGQKQKLDQLKQEIENNKMQIVELKKEIDVARELNRGSLEEVNNMAYMNDFLIKHLPQVSERQSYIQEVHSNDDGKGYLMVDFAKMVHDKNDPNGFHIENKAVVKEKLPIDEKELLVYKVEGADLRYSSLEELENSKHAGFYNLYFVNNNLVIIEEQYLP